MKVLFAPFPQLGHLTPAFAVARCARERGHDIGFLSARDLGAELAAAGLDAPSLGVMTSEPASATEVPVENERFLSRFYAAAALRGFAERAIFAAAEAIELFRPDVICADPIFYAPIIAATRAGIPWASVSTDFLPVAPRGFSCVLTRAMANVSDELVRRFAHAGVDVKLVHQEVISPWLNTVFASEDFVPRAWSGNDFSWFVGPVARTPSVDGGAFPWDALDAHRPIIYVSSGGGESFTFPDEVFQNIAEALPPREQAQAVFALQGRFDGPLPARLPSHVIAVRRAPQLALLERAELVVTHGGANTVAECLRSGRPMLVLPIGHEQPLQAELVERAGIGLALPMRASTSEIAAAIARLRGEPTFRDRAAVLAKTYAGRDGAAVVAEKLLQLGRDRVPQPPDLGPR